MPDRPPTKPPRASADSGKSATPPPRKFQINPGPLRVVDTSHRDPRQGRGVHPKEFRVDELTRLQGDVLFIVEEHGPVTASEVASHLLIGTGSARGVLSRLEGRRLIDATYTNLRSGRRGRGYVSTARGSQALADFDREAENDA